MNHRIICRTLGKILLLEAGLMIPSLLVGVIYKEKSVLSFLISIAITALAGFIMTSVKGNEKKMFAKDGFVIVGLAWIFLSAFGALPFVISGSIPSYVDAFFETASGFTTTGSSILTEIESLERGILFWRSFTHWVGGMGVLVFLLAVVPQSNDYSMHIMRAESPGPSVGKIVPKIQNTAAILYKMYLGLTVLMILLLLCTKMPLFDSICNAMATAGTGGFAIKNSSIAAYNNVAAEVVITVFMILFGVNFNIYYLLLSKKLKEIVQSEELKVYLGVVLVSILLITINIANRYGSIFEALRYSSFSVGTVISTTGFGTADFNLWPSFSKCILVLLMLIGSCAGSTGGGLKISRFVILMKSVNRELKQISHPNSIHRITFDGKSVTETLVNGVIAYFSVYIVIMLISMLIVSLDGFDFETTVTAVIACFNNIGPGLGAVGPTGNYAAFSVVSKLILSADMLLGRLEIYPMLILVSKDLWFDK